MHCRSFFLLLFPCSNVFFFLGGREGRGCCFSQRLVVHKAHLGLTRETRGWPSSHVGDTETRREREKERKIGTQRERGGQQAQLDHCSSVPHCRFSIRLPLLLGPLPPPLRASLAVCLERGEARGAEAMAKLEKLCVKRRCDVCCHRTKFEERGTIEEVRRLFGWLRCRLSVQGGKWMSRM